VSELREFAMHYQNKLTEKKKIWIIWLAVGLYNQQMQ